MSNTTTHTKSGSDDQPQAKYKSTNLAILHHVWLYNLTFKHAVEKLFFPSDPSITGTTLTALVRLGYLNNMLAEQPPPKISSKPNKSIPTNKHKTTKSSNRPNATQPQKTDIDYYVLGSEGLKLLQSYGRFTVPKERMKPPGVQSLYNHLATLWYCVFDGPRRYRLDKIELQALFKHTIPEGTEIPPQTPFCLTKEGDKPVIYRVYPCTKENLKQAPRELERKIKKEMNVLNLHSWIKSGQYGYAVLLSSEARKTVFEKALERQKRNLQLLANTKITAHFAPDPEALLNALKQNGHLQQSKTSKLPSLQS